MHTFIRSTAAAATLALAAAFAPSAFALDTVPTEEMRSEIQRTLDLLPEASDRRVSVNIDNGMYVISGFVNGIEGSVDARQALADIEGLDGDLVDIRVIRE